MNRIDERYRKYYLFNEGLEWLKNCLKEDITSASLIQPILNNDLSLWCQNPDPVLGRKALLNEDGAWGAVAREDTPVEVITGMFRLEFQHCKALHLWLHHLCGRNHFVWCKEIFKNGFIVSDHEGILWQIMNYDGDDPAGEPIHSPARMMIFNLFFFLRQNLEAFGGSFMENGILTALGYLNPQHPRYVPQLAAAVRVWEALGHERAMKDRPKKALTDWLTEHRRDFHPSGKGELTKNNIKNIATLANWEPKGGAPRKS